jgi:hypothetical protein
MLAQTVVLSAIRSNELLGKLLAGGCVVDSSKGCASVYCHTFFKAESSDAHFQRLMSSDVELLVTNHVEFSKCLKSGCSPTYLPPDL